MCVLLHAYMEVRLNNELLLAHVGLKRLAATNYLSVKSYFAQYTAYQMKFIVEKRSLTFPPARR